MNTLFISVRAVHILLAAIWLGAAFVTALFLGPAVQDAGPAGGAVMSGFMKRGFEKVMASFGGITVLSGAWLYWRMTQGFDASLMSSHIGLMFGAGGVLGVAGAVVGGSVVGRSSKAMFELGKKMSQMPDGPRKPRHRRPPPPCARRLDRARSSCSHCSPPPWC